MRSSKDRNYAAMLSLSPEVAKRIEKIAEDSEVEFHELLGKLASQAVSLLSAGAIIIPKAKLQRLSELGGVPIENERDILTLLEKLFQRREDNIVASYEIDATWETHLGEVAARSGKTVQQLISDSFTRYIIENLFELPQEAGSPILFSAEQLQRIRELTGRPSVSANDIMFYMPKPKRREAA